MNNLKRKTFTKKAILLTFAALAFVLNIAVSTQLESNSSSLNGVVNSAFADDESLGIPSLPIDMAIINPDKNDNKKPVEDEGIVSYIISLFE